MYKNLLSLCSLLAIGSVMESNSLTVKSTSFKHTKPIPRRCAYNEKNISPQLSWSSGPSRTKSYVIVCKDPDAPTQNPWLHWLLFDVPADVTSLEEGYRLEKGGKSGVNDYGKKGYGGPNPPSGTHRYYFHVHALDVKTLPKIPMNKKKVDQSKLDTLLDTHTIAKGTLMGTYSA